MIEATLIAAGDPGLFTYFGQSNVAGKIIVVLLLAFSLLAWTVMIGKFLDLRRLSGLNARFESRLKQSDDLTQIDPESSQPLGSGPYALLTTEALEAFHRYQADPSVEGLQACVGHVENALQRAVADQTIRYESNMVWLASIVSGAPFLGLLGTVWGVMDAFGAVALQSSASLQALAPGVSGALLTTVAGLVVAIPSVFGYNYLLTQVKIRITELENFASSLADRIELDMRFGPRVPESD